MASLNDRINWSLKIGSGEPIPVVMKGGISVEELFAFTQSNKPFIRAWDRVGGNPIEELESELSKMKQQSTDPRSIFQPFFDDMKEYFKEFNQIKSQNMKTEKEFAVKSDSFALYEAFKKECEAIGWKYNHEFTRFDRSQMGGRTMLYFSTNWSNDDGSGFAFSHPADTKQIFDLGSQFSEALAYAKKVFEEHLKEIEESKKKKVTYEDVEKKLFRSVVHYHLSGSDILDSMSDTISYMSPVRSTNLNQLMKLLFMNKLMNVAVYLNPKGEKADWSISEREGEFRIGVAHSNFGQPMFTSKELAQQAIEILGEGVVRLALS